MLHGKRVQESDLSSRCPELLSHLEALRSGKHDHIKFSCIIHVGAEARRLSISLRRLAGDRSEPAGALVFCDDVTDREKLQSAVEQLEATSEELQSANEELETTNEELQSTNEELETTNEELQSTNEELETTNEELQSLNEELENMNEELERSTEELHAVSARYAETLQNLPWPVLLLDGQERVRLWNSAAERVFGITPTAVLGQGLDVLPLDGNLHEAIARNSRGVAQKGKAAMLRGQQVTMKGATRVFDLHFTPLAPHRHESEGVLVVFNPIEVNGAAATSPAEGKTAATTVKRVGSARKKSKTPSRSRAGSKKK
jgi:two-component system CheB/CheR fusion protein